MLMAQSNFGMHLHVSIFFPSLFICLCAVHQLDATLKLQLKQDWPSTLIIKFLFWNCSNNSTELTAVMSTEAFGCADISAIQFNVCKQKSLIMMQQFDCGDCFARFVFILFFRCSGRGDTLVPTVYST